MICFFDSITDICVAYLLPNMEIIVSAIGEFDESLYPCGYYNIDHHKLMPIGYYAEELFVYRMIKKEDHNDNMHEV